jgi:hypothetical protein
MNRLMNILFHGLYLIINNYRDLRLVSEVPTGISGFIRWLPADCSKLYIVTEIK